MPALRLTGVTGNATMHPKKRQPTLIENIYGLDPDFHETRCGQANVPTVIGQVGWRWWLGPMGTAT
ncbi:hypothetical protein D3C80_2151570 [compost metagenome]